LSLPANFASFTLSSATPIAQILFCSHNGGATYNIIPFSGSTTAPGGGGTGGGGGGGTGPSTNPITVPGTANIFAAVRTSVPALTGGGGTLPPYFAIPANSAGQAVTVTNVSG